MGFWWMCRWAQDASVISASSVARSQVVATVAHIFLWFYVQKRLERPLWVEDRLPIQFSYKLANKVVYS